MIDIMQPRSIATKSLKSEESSSMQVEDQSESTASKQLKNIQLDDKNKEKKVMTNDDFRSFLLKKN